MDRFTDGVSRLLEALSVATATTSPTSDGSSGKHALPEDYDNPLWRIGLSDGRLGQTPHEHDEILQTLADRKWQVEMEQAEALLNAKQKELAELRRRVEHGQELSEETDARLTAIRALRVRSRGEFSRSVGWAYVAIGILLFAADMPLSLKFVSDAFEIKLSETPLEAYLVALGVAGVGFFFKIAADFVIASPPEIEPPKTWRFWLAASFMASTLAATAWTLWYVGEVRAVAKANASTATGNATKTTRGTLGSRQLTPEQERAALDAAKKKQQRQDEQNRIIDTGFKLMAFTFPLVGAVCVSVGLKRVHNGSELRQLEKESERARINYDHDAARLQGVTADVANHEEQKRRVAARRGEDYKLWRGIYLHGYLRGTCVPQSLNDGAAIHELVERMVERWLAITARTQNRRLAEEAKK